MQSNKQFSQACENNKGPILEQLDTYFQATTKVLEIGSGTGQHAAFFSENLPHLIWQPSDLPNNHASINAWIAEADSHNVKLPISYQVGRDDWPEGLFDGVFSANTAHIMQPQETQLMMAEVAKHLPKKGIFCQYGPFKLKGEFTSESNREFHQHLVAQGYGGIQKLEDLQKWAKPLQLNAVVEMPANNLMLVWYKLDE